MTRGAGGRLERHRGSLERRPLLAALLCAALLATGCATTGIVAPSAQEEYDVGPNRPDVILAFGDSITYGRDSGDGNGYRKTLEELLAGSGRHVTIVNDGIPGSWSGHGAQRIQKVLRKHKPAVVLILYGTNDAYEGIDPAAAAAAAEGNIRTIVETAQRRRTIPVVATLPPVCGRQVPSDRQLGWYSENYVRLAREKGIPLADVRRAFEENGGCALIGPGGKHPTDRGYALIAEVFFRTLQELRW